MERSVYAHMTRFSLAPMCDWFLVLVASYLCTRVCACPCFPLCVFAYARVCVKVWKDSSVQGYVRGRALNRGGINEDNMSHIFGSGAGTGNEAGLVWVTAAHVLVCHCPVSLCVKLADIDTCSP